MIELRRFDADPARRLEERAKLHQLSGGPHVVLETCDRLELYRGDGQPDRETLRYLAAVAAGLESPLPGEKAVQGQVKSAYLAAQAGQTLSSGLHVLFQNALGIAKTVRTKSAIDQGSITHAGAVAHLLRQRGLIDTTEGIVLLGVNELSESILRFLVGHQSAGLILTNRNLEKAKAMAGNYGAHWGDLADLDQELAHCRVAISCTAAPHYIIKPEHFENRDGRPLLLFDLAAPPDVHPDVGLINGVELLGLQEVESLMREHLQSRIELVASAQTILEGEIERWVLRQNAKKAYAGTL